MRERGLSLSPLTPKWLFSHITQLSEPKDQYKGSFLSLSSHNRRYYTMGWALNKKIKNPPSSFFLGHACLCKGLRHTYKLQGTSSQGRLFLPDSPRKSTYTLRRSKTNLSTYQPKREQNALKNSHNNSTKIKLKGVEVWKCKNISLREVSGHQ